MKTRAIMTLVAVAGAAVAANAQTGGTATYSIEFSNGTAAMTLDPTGVLAPISTSVSVFVTINPVLNSPYGTAPPLQGFIFGHNNGAFSITGTGAGGGSGNFSVPAVIPGPPPQHPALAFPYNFLPGVATNQGTSSGDDHNGVLWGHGFYFTPVHQLPATKAKVWEGTFTATSGVGSMSLAFTGLALTGVDVSSGPIANMAIPWVADFASNGGQGGNITFIPAPASLALLGLGGLVALRRRR